jgi:hypothetical protein
VRRHADFFQETTIPKTDAVEGLTMEDPDSSISKIAAIVDSTMILPSLHTDMNIILIPEIIKIIMTIIIITSPTN